LHTLQPFTEFGVHVWIATHAPLVQLWPLEQVPQVPPQPLSPQFLPEQFAVQTEEVLHTPSTQVVLSGQLLDHQSMHPSLFA
jgi:hypothetical protein